VSLIVISNREPYAPHPAPAAIPAQGGPGPLEPTALEWAASIGGLTTALDPVMQRTGGTWVAWGEKYPEIRQVQLPQHDPKYTVERVPLSEDEVSAYYHGFSNSALWPMSHYSLERVHYRAEEWAAYRRINERFAEAAAAHYREGDVFWVQDYQLALVPGLLRERFPQARIGFFWHIPWPAQDVFRTLPWDEEILRGILGADLIGMHTGPYVRHFQDACQRTLDAEITPGTVTVDGRTVRVEARPIGIDVDTFEEIARRPETVLAAGRLRENLRTMMLLAIDRLDYTKGIPERLEAFAAFLERHPEQRGRVTLVQVAVPSREAVDAYAQLRSQVEGLVGRINGQFGADGWTPVHYNYRGLNREELVAHYRAADAMLVTPLRDGLNLVAKEFAACSEDGVLLLSRFAGAAGEMPGAIPVNPYDVDGLSGSLVRALSMPLAEKKARLQTLKAGLRASDLRAWTADFLRDLSVGEHLPPGLTRLAERPLLILSDYDGTLAPITRRPQDAEPQPGVREALTRLMAHPAHEVAIVTGRRSVQVAGFLPIPDLPVVGLHGMEWPEQPLPRADRAALDTVARAVPEVPGVVLEDKRWTLAVHVRNVAPDRQDEALHALDALPVPDGWERIRGKMVREFRPVGYGKGHAARTLMRQFPEHLPVFLGDDVTDEEAVHAVNDAGGVTVKVGEGDSAARYRLDDPADVAALLTVWAGSSATPAPERTS